MKILTVRALLLFNVLRVPRWRNYIAAYKQLQLRYLIKIYKISFFPVLSQDQAAARRWLNITFWLNLVEVGSLCGVTYISNRENYRKLCTMSTSSITINNGLFAAVHEKLFITFMVSSLTHMLACIKGIKLVAQTNNDVEEANKRLKVKKLLFITSLISTAGLVGFFLEHRYLCHDMGN